MLQRSARWAVLLVLAIALATTVLTAAKIASDPQISPYEPASAGEILAGTQKMLADITTSDVVLAHIRLRLNDYPRNWLGLTALLDYAQARGVALPPDLVDALAIAKEDDHGLYAFTTSCATCAGDPGLCSLAQVFICQTPLALPPAPGVAAVTAVTAVTAAESISASGQGKDQAVLAMAIAASRAEALAPFVGGDADAIRDGARLAMLAHRMALVSPALETLASDAALDGVDWAALATVKSDADLATATRAEAFAPLAMAMADLHQLAAASTTLTALYLLPLIDTANDARALTAAAKVLGPQVIVAAELLGKQNLIRSTQQLGKTGWTLVAGLAGIWLCLAILFGSWLKQRKRRQSPSTATVEPG